MRDRAFAVYGGGDRAVHQALLLVSLSGDAVLLTDGDADLPAEQSERLAAAGVALVNSRVGRIREHGNGLRIVFTGRAPLARRALFIQPKPALESDLAVSLGATLADVGSVQTDAAGQTSVPGLYAAGDAGSTVQSVAVATGSGARGLRDQRWRTPRRLLSGRGRRTDEFADRSSSPRAGPSDKSQPRTADEPPSTDIEPRPRSPTDELREVLSAAATVTVMSSDRCG